MVGFKWSRGIKRENLRFEKDEFPLIREVSVMILYILSSLEKYTCAVHAFEDRFRKAHYDYRNVKNWEESEMEAEK